ncbi:MAG: SapC family protein [Halarcobacter sp.]
MYKNIEILDKEKLKGFKFDEVNTILVAKSIGLIPLGFSEVWTAAHDCPVIINSLDRGEFTAFTGITTELNIYNKENAYIPAFVRTYPFLSVDIKNEEGTFSSVISIDNNSQYVSKKKKENIFTKDKQLSENVNSKVETIRELNRQRDISRKIVQELKENDLLIKKDFKVKNNDIEKTFLEEFYIVDVKKLVNIEDSIIASWAKKGWMGIIDAHIKSLSNFPKVLSGK